MLFRNVIWCGSGACGGKQHASIKYVSVFKCELLFVCSRENGAKKIARENGEEEKNVSNGTHHFLQG